MDLIAAICPECRSVHALNDCGTCAGTVVHIEPLRRSVIAATARARILVDKGDLVAAHCELSLQIGAFPFLIEPLHFFLRLCFEVGDYPGGMRALAWLQPALSSVEIDEGRALITQCHRAQRQLASGTNDGAEPGAAHGTAVLQHLSGLLGDDRAPIHETTGPAHTSPRPMLNRFAAALIVALIILSTASTLVMVNARRSTKDAERHLAVRLTEIQAGRNEVDTLRSRVAQLEAAATAPGPESTRSAEQSADIPEIEARIVELGPNVVYRILGLGDDSSPDRTRAMSIFVDLYPDSPVYTGYFLRELHDRASDTEPPQALAWAMRLQAYVGRYPELSHLISSNVQETLSKGESR